MFYVIHDNVKKPFYPVNLLRFLATFSLSNDHTSRHLDEEILRRLPNIVSGKRIDIVGGKRMETTVNVKKTDIIIDEDEEDYNEDDLN